MHHQKQLLAVQVPGPMLDDLHALVATGLYGYTADEAAERLIAQGLRRERQQNGLLSCRPITAPP